MNKKIIIAIDGHSGCGKSSTAKVVAKALGYIYIDTGAMYRAATFFFLTHKINVADPAEVDEALSKIDISFKLNGLTQKTETHLNGRCVEEEIREMEVSENVSEVSAISAVRRKMVSLQRKMGEHKGIVMDGRDIGTVVFPHAELKIFMTADLLVRAKRRLAELAQNGKQASLEVVKQNLEKRDAIDSSRKDSPLMKAADAIIIDTSSLSFEEQTEKIVTLAQIKISGN